MNRRFDEAVSGEDLASIERFFKIFPLINLHDVGLNKFTLYLRGKLATANKAGYQSNAQCVVIFFCGLNYIIDVHRKTKDLMIVIKRLRHKTNEIMHFLYTLCYYSFVRLIIWWNGCTRTIWSKLLCIDWLLIFFLEFAQWYWYFLRAHWCIDWLTESVFIRKYSSDWLIDEPVYTGQSEASSGHCAGR